MESDWTPILIADIEYFVAFSILREPLGYKMLLTDFEQAWESTLHGQQLIQYKQKTMPQLTTGESELVDILKKQIYNCTDESLVQPRYSLSNSKNWNRVILTLESKIGFFPFSWSFHCHRIKDCMGFIKNSFVLPLFVVQHELVRRLACLEQILHDKDRQIQEYQKLGIKIPKSLQVPPFDKAVFDGDMAKCVDFTAHLNRPLKKMKAPTTNIITAYQNHISTQKSASDKLHESDSEDVFEKNDTSSNKNKEMSTKSSQNTDMASFYQEGVGLFSLQLRDEQKTQPSPTKTRTTTETNLGVKLKKRKPTWGR